MSRLVAGLLLACALDVPARADDGPLSPRLRDLQQRLAADPSAVASFWAEVERTGAPLVEPVPDRADYSYVTFLWRGASSTRDVLVTSLEQHEIRNPGYLPYARMEKLGTTDVWFKTQRMRNDTRLTYQVSPDDPLTMLADLEQKDWPARTASFRPDPLNARRFDTRNGLASVLELPAAPPQPWITRQPDVPAGRVEKHSFRSAILGNERALHVYVPAGYDASREPVGLVVFFDGGMYLSLVPAPVILDNLIAKGRIPPVVGVFVEPGPQARGQELGFGEPFQEALAKEIVPWVRRTWRVSEAPGTTAVAGLSLGGTAAAFTGLRHPEIFGNVLSQSGGFHFAHPPRDNFKRPLPGQLFEEDVLEYEWIVHQFVKAPRADVRFYLENGLREEASWEFPIAPFAMPSLVGATRHLRDVLEAKGYDVTYSEYAGGHEPICWRGTLADGLIALIGRTPLSASAGPPR